MFPIVFRPRVIHSEHTWVSFAERRSLSRQSNGINLGLGDSFLGLYEISNPGHIHHFCVGVDDYEIHEAAMKLEGAGIEPFVRQDRPQIYFSDPDGIRVQLSEKDYRG